MIPENIIRDMMNKIADFTSRGRAERRKERDAKVLAEYYEMMVMELEQMLEQWKAEGRK